VSAAVGATANAAAGSTAGTATGSAAVRLAGLRIGYPGHPVLEQLDLTVADGEIRVLLGPSGCGKSTLLRTIAGLQPPLAGEVQVTGAPVHGPSGERVLVFQDDGLLPWRSVRRNVELPMAIRRVSRARRRATALHWLERVGLTESADRLPRQLSGGMRQRVQLARALAGGPRLLLMDEPFGALDAQTRTAMQALLVEVWRAAPRTIVFVTHDIDEALALGDRITVLRPDGGELIDVPAPRAPVPDHPDYRGVRTRVLAALHGTTPAQERH
jgi:NitT/TauT family transport system ATP-binding protein